MSWFKRKQEYYNEGYRQGNRSDEYLEDVGHTPESFAEHLEQTHGWELLDPRFTADEQEFVHGLLDGSQDKVKKRKK